jgi:hypothetical protein
MPSKIELLKTRDFGEIITDSFIFIRENLKPLLKNFFIFCGFFLLASICTAIIQQTKMLNVINDNNFPNSAANPFGTANPFRFFGIEYFLTLVFELLNFTAMHVVIYSYLVIFKEKGNLTPTTEELWGYFKYYYLKILGSGLLIFFLLVFGFVLCIIPGVYLYPILALVFPIMIFENTSFGYAFNRSFRLIKDNWWITFGTLLVVGIIVYFAVMIIVLPLTIINISSVLFHPGKGVHLSGAVTIITSILQHLCEVFYIIPLVAVSLIYFNLTEKIENTGLMGRIGKLGDLKDTDDTPTEEY